MKNKLLYFTIPILFFLIFKNYSLVLDATITSFDIWLNKVFPYLFIMIILNDVLLSLNFVTIFKKPSLYVFFLSLTSGSPTSAIIINNLYTSRKIDKDYANITLLFSYFANPLFLYTILNTIFNSFTITIKLILIHYLSNFLIYLLFRKKLSPTNTYSINSTINIASSIKKAMTTTTMVLGAITFYLVISNILSLPLLLRGIMEMTQGLNSLITLDFAHKDLLCMLFISFGGISIHTQVKCILDETDLDYTYFLKGRIYQTIIAIILTTITKAI